MSAHCEVTAKRASGVQLGVFERYLTLWVFLCIVVGIGLGHFFNSVFQTIGGLEIAKVNLPVAALIWLMIIPMLLKIDFKALHQVKEHWKGVAVTLFVNWAVKPFSMALLGWLFIYGLFRDWLPADQLDAYVAGLIILAAAPCTAMVFVWSNLSDGEPHFTLTQVALNDIIMIFAFAPIVGLLLGISAITVPWDTLFLSVVLYIVIPVALAHVWRKRVLHTGGPAALQKLLARLQPLSLLALLTTLILLFGFQGEQIIAQPLIIVLLAVPILIQVYFNSGLAYLLNRAVGSPHNVAAPSALIGASNFFELAVAAAIALFGFSSGAALATVVGVLVEVPVMLSVVKIVNHSKSWYGHFPCGYLNQSMRKELPMITNTPDNIRSAVRETYGKIAEQGGGCCGGGCGAPAITGTAAEKLGYSADDVNAVPAGANLDLGCGNPQAIAALKPGETVLDLGSGAGFDAFLAARAVGDSGWVIGIDMTHEMLSKARDNASKANYTNVEFRLGEIEHLPVADASVDVIISNCVINLSPDKHQVFREAFRVLRPNGRLAISDIVASAELPDDVRRDLALYTGCMAGASQIGELEAMLREAGFADIRIQPKDTSREFIRDWAPGRRVEDYVVSASIEAIKP